MVGQYLLNQIEISLENIEIKNFNQVVNILCKYNNIFIAGAGRSGFVGNFFGMRLMHIGKNSYIVGETNTPSIKKGDLLVAISGSGTTSAIVDIAQKAQQHGATLLTVTNNPQSELYKSANYKIFIDLEQKNEESKRVFVNTILREIPMGTSFELSALICLETIISEVMYVCQISEEEMNARHVNL